MPIYWQHDFTTFCTLCHYVIINLNVNENHLQYVQVTQYTFRELSYRKLKNWKKSLKINVRCHSTSAWNDVWAMPESYRYAYHWYVDKRRCSEFPTPWSTISRLLNRFQHTGNVTDRPRSGRPHKTTPLEDRVLTNLSWRNRFLPSQKLGCLLRNATGTRVCDRTVRNRLHAARLKVCRPDVGIPLTWRNYRGYCCTVFATT